MITIVDYGLGNLGSVANMLRKVGVKSVISGDASTVAAAEALILPGVGHFDMGMKNLRERGLEGVLTSLVLEKKVPVIGICLGMQLLARKSEEGKEPGLAWIAADVKRFDFTGRPPLAIPHMGWSEVETKDEVLFKGHVPGETRFYFVHSYHLVSDDPLDVAAWATYGYRFAASVRRGNICGAQFHPEKSHRHGMALLKNWVELAGQRDGKGQT
ncbi:MAG: imidazole glycerol phosphate synthase subunit HisH [Myxococcales bacterium]|nr:imidazole glycerol phosphate synthase subunit HisH [Myxococcales bacterium]